MRKGGNALELMSCWVKLKVAVIIAWDAMSYNDKTKGKVSSCVAHMTTGERTVARTAKTKTILKDSLDIQLWRLQLTDAPIQGSSNWPGDGLVEHSIQGGAIVDQTSALAEVRKDESWVDKSAEANAD